MRAIAAETKCGEYSMARTNRGQTGHGLRSYTANNWASDSDMTDLNALRPQRHGDDPLDFRQERRQETGC